MAFAWRFPKQQVAEGEIFAIIGPNGTGKITFIKAVLGMRKLAAGIVELLGWPLRELTRKPALRAPLGIATISQPRLRYAGKRAGAAASTPAWASGRRIAYSARHRQPPATRLWRAVPRRTAARRSIILITHVPEDLQIADRVLWIADGGTRALAPAGSLRLVMVGTHSGDIHLRQESDAAAIEKMWKAQTASVKAIIWESPLRARIFGSEKLTEMVPLAARDCRALSFGIGATTLTGFLWLASRR